LRSKKKEQKSSTSNQDKISYLSTKIEVAPKKGNLEQNNHPVVKALIPEVKEIMKSPSYFNIENEIQKIKMPVSFLELIKNEDFKKSISKMLQYDFSSQSKD
jgi:hypothetical protein